MLDKRTIFDIHRLADEGGSVRAIARTLHLARKTVAKYLRDPNPPRRRPERASKLDPFRDEIGRLLAIDPTASAVVVRQRIAPQGFEGGITIVRDYLRRVRPAAHPKPAFVRFESPPGQQCQIDWGHFGALAYGATQRKLYCLAVVVCHSRLLYLEFTHSQRQETFHRCLLHAFQFFQGTPRELVHDNLATAVLERDGPLVRFNEPFLEFLRPFKIVPLACGVAKPHEKGKVEKGAIHYIRHNFWPLRTFTGLGDVQNQATDWRDQVANRRVHRTTGQRPVERFEPHALRPLPELLPDCRDTQLAKVHSDFSVHFDANTYTVPPWAVGKTVVVKADAHHVIVYLKDKPIATHPRCWQRKQRIELPHHRQAAHRHHARHWRSEEVAAFVSLGELAKRYLERLAATQQPLKKSVQRLLALRDAYGTPALLTALEHALAHQAYGAHYVENILHQHRTPQTAHPPVQLRLPHLNRIRLEEPSLADYDAFVLRRRKAHD
jgi:transposase